MPVQQLKVSYIFSRMVLLAKAVELHQHNSIIAKHPNRKKTASKVYITALKVSLLLPCPNFHF